MQRYRDNLKKLKKDFYALLHFLHEKQASLDPLDQEFIRTVEPDFFLINRFGDIVREYSALK